MTGIGALLDYFRGLLQHPEEVEAREALARAANTFAGFSLLSSGSVDIDSRRYFLAEILVLQGHKDAAIEELHRTLELADGGFVSKAPVEPSPENRSILADLRDQPGYNDWLAKFTTRRSAMREKMIGMEATGEIVPAP